MPWAAPCGRRTARPFSAVRSGACCCGAGTASWAATRMARAGLSLRFRACDAGRRGGRLWQLSHFELPYVFDTLPTLNRPWTDNDRKVSSILQAYWVNFIKTGDPNGGGLPRWVPFDRSRNDAMALGLASGMRRI